MMKKLGYNYRIFQKLIIPSSLPVSFYYFLGLLCTDGHIQFVKKGGKYRVMLYTSELKEKEIILRLIKSLFNYNASVRARETGFSDRLNYEIYISSKSLCEFFHNLGIPYGAKSYNIRVPKLFSNRNERIFWNYLRGVFDGDGSIIFSGSVCTFKISSGSQEFIKDIQKIMSKYNFLNTHVSRQKQNVWELKINARRDISRLYRLIYRDARFFYPRKKSKWESNMFKNTSQ
jgi:DNA-binding transcriptional regulator WhiA